MLVAANGEEVSMGATDSALEGLRALIADGILLPGDRIPSESELCDRLGVSRGSLREAIRTLQALGIVETRHGSGTYVGSLRAADVIGQLTLTVGLLPLESVLELYELRRVLESHTASLASARADDVAVTELSGVLDRIERISPDVSWSNEDHEFHLRIAQLANNPALTALTDVLRTRSRSYAMFETADAAEIKRVSDAGHRAILAGIAGRDPVAASVAAAAHVAQTEVWLRKNRPKPHGLDA